MPDTPSGEKLMLQVLDKVLAIVTAAPQAGSDLTAAQQGTSRHKPENTVVQLAMPGVPLYFEDFKEMFHPGNTEGDKAKTALFSWLVDAIPSTGTLKYEQTPRRVSLAYKAIVAGANAPSPAVSGAMQKKLEQASAVLYNQDGSKSADHKEYLRRQDDLAAAQDTLRHASKRASDLALQYHDDVPDFDAKPEAERKRLVALYKRKAQDYFEDAYPAAKRSVLRALDELADARMARVDEALTFLRTNGKELSAHLLKSIKDQLEVGDLAHTDQALKVPVMLSFPSSTAFANPSNDAGWMPIVCNSESLDLKQSETAKRSGGSAQGSWFLWFCRAGASHSEVTEKCDVTSSSFQIGFDLAVINILRPWMDATLFSEAIVWDAGRDQGAGSVSSGKFETQTDSLLLPLVPTQMLVARNVKIIADWTDEHRNFIKTHTEAGGRLGWGPFAIGADHGEDSANLSRKSDSGKATLTLSGLQCIGFVSWVPPLAAPLPGTPKSGTVLVPPSAEVGKRYQEAAQSALARLATPPKHRRAAA